jgi:hypothetical protein
VNIEKRNIISTSAIMPKYKYTPYEVKEFSLGKGLNKKIKTTAS